MIGYEWLFIEEPETNIIGHIADPAFILSGKGPGFFLLAGRDNLTTKSIVLWMRAAEEAYWQYKGMKKNKLVFCM